MATTMTRAQWLRQEIQIDERRLARSPVEGDWAEVAYQDRVRREVQAKREELAIIEGGGGRLDVRLAGGVIEGHNAPADLVLEVGKAIDHLADEYEAELFMAPALPGSHVIRFVTSAAPTLPFEEVAPQPQTFNNAVSAVMDLADGGAGLEARREIDAVVGQFSEETLKAMRRLYSTLSQREVSILFDITSPTRVERRRVDRQWASFVTHVLDDTEKSTEPVTITGLLRGFTKGSGRFEIEVAEDEQYSGRVPKAVRDQGAGIPIDSLVTATLDKVTTSLPSGGRRSFYRLTEIGRASAT